MGLFVPKQAPWSGDSSFQLYGGFGPNYSSHVLLCWELNWGEDSIIKMGLLCFSKYFQAMVVDEVIKSGRRLGRKGRCPLMFEWYGEKYWGAAHGLAGIMHVLMDMELKPDELEDVKGTLKYMMSNRFPSGNYPASEDDRKSDVLVHWCHGAPGIALTLVKAAKVIDR